MCEPAQVELLKEIRDELRLMNTLFLLVQVPQGFLKLLASHKNMKSTDLLYLSNRLRGDHDLAVNLNALIDQYRELKPTIERLDQEKFETTPESDA